MKISRWIRRSIPGLLGLGLAGLLLSGCADSGAPAGSGTPATIIGTPGTASTPSGESPGGASAGSPDQAADGGAPVAGQSGPDASAEEDDSSVIYRGDILVVDVFGEDDLNRETEVDKDGTVNLPLIGQVSVAGKTKIEVQKLIAELYGRDYLKSPVVTVDVKRQERARERRVVTVLGEVRNPGVFPVPPEGTLRLSEVISMAGGFTDIAAPRKIEVSRIGPKGRTRVGRFSFAAITSGKIDDVELQPGDIVTVPRSVW